MKIQKKSRHEEPQPRCADLISRVLPEAMLNRCASKMLENAHFKDVVQGPVQYNGFQNNVNSFKP